MKAIAYYRVSTKEQGEHGHGIEGQRVQVKRYANNNGLDIIAEYEEHETGTSKRQRVEIYKAIDAALSNDAILLIADISRLARDVHFITELQKSGVKFVAIDMPSANEMTVQLMAVFAEEYARAVAKGTRRGLEGAKAKGVKLGNDGKYLTDEGRKKGGETMRQRAMDYYRSNSIYRTIALLHEKGDSLREIAETLNKDKVKTRRGGQFHPTTVKRILDRAAA